MRHVPHRVETGDEAGIDYGWVMQVTFLIAIVVGVPIIAGLALFVELPTLEDRGLFALQIGALVWIVIAAGVYTYARYTQ